MAACWRLVARIISAAFHAAGVMIGQGRPRTPATSFRFAARLSPRTPLLLRALAVTAAVIAIGACGGWFSFAAEGEPAKDQVRDVRLRVAWGGGDPRRWEGTVELSSGTFSELAPLGVDADQVGSITVDGSKLHIRQRGPRSYDGFDVLVNAPDDAGLTLRFTEADGESPVLAVALSELMREMKESASWGTGGNRLLVLRAPSDALRVSFPDGRDSLVFSPGEMFKFDISPHRLPIAAGTKLRLRAQVSQAHGGREQSSQEIFRDVAADGQVEPWPLEIKLPDAPGVYDIQIAAHEWGLRQRLDPARRFVPGAALATRVVQLVVVGQTAVRPSPEEAVPFASIVELDPANPRWWQRYIDSPQLAKLKLAPKHSWTHGRVERWQHPTLGAAMAIDVDAWEALPLPVEDVGVPHIVEIEYAGDMPQALGISVLDPNAADEIAPGGGLDSGIHVDPSATTLTDKGVSWRTHRLVFWPRTKTPILLLTNRDPAQPAVHGKIRVLAGPARLPPMFAPEDAPAERLLAAYLDRPLVAENFCASESRDAWSGRSLKDWATFNAAAARMADYLHFAGYNGAMVSVFAEGSTLYPSRLLEPTPRHDTGAFFSTGQDPRRKDVVELMLRVFERERLAFIPAVRFHTPLPELERILARGDVTAATGLVPIGPDGLAWTAVHPTTGGAAPYYNILDPRVQQAMLDVFDELINRYGRHPALAGVALQIDGNDYATLPGIEWGLDDVTWAAFERETNTKLSAAGADRYAKRAEAVTGTSRRAWLAWRSGRVAQFHKKAAAIVAKAGPDVRLFITTAGLMDSPPLRSVNKPSLTRATNLSEALLAVGIDAAAYERPDSSNIVFVPTRRANRSVPELNAAAADAVPKNDLLSAALSYYEPLPLRLPSFDEKGPLGKDKTYTRLLTHLTPADYAGRQRFTKALAASDAALIFDGGLLAPLSQDTYAARHANVFRRLPLGFQTLPGGSQGVTIRTRDEARRTLAYLVNDAPWPATVEIDVAASARCRVVNFAPKEIVNQILQGVWRVELGPHDLVAVAFTEPGVVLSNPRVTIDPAEAKRLGNAVKDLRARTQRLVAPPLFSVLANPDFESPPVGERIPGWESTGRDGATTTVVTGAAQGKQAAALRSTGRVSSLVGDWFDLPTSGRLAIEVMLRTPDENLQPSLRVAVETTSGRRSDYRWRPVGAGQPNFPVRSAWGLYLFSFEDLPTDRGGRARLRFDLMGAGETVIDDVKLHHLSFSQNERIGLGKIVSLADSHLSAGRLADCARVLEGYWPRYLAENVPLEAPPVMQAQRNNPAPAKPEGVMDRLKKYKPF